MGEYIHGFSKSEQQRLLDQNAVVSKYIYKNLNFDNITHLLELGCGVGAQMIYLLKKYPNLKITGVDISAIQIDQAIINLKEANIDSTRYKLIQVDLTKSNTLPLDAFDGLLIIWVLEHVKDPVQFLSSALPSLKKGARIQITEVFNTSLNIHPFPNAIMDIWGKANALQLKMGMDPYIGLRLGNVMSDTGLKEVNIKPFAMHWDKSTPKLRSEKLKYWEGLLQSGFVSLLENGMSTESDWAKAKKEFELLQTNDNAVFHYTFVQGFGKV